MLILALTILGLSLFSLSAYESQFMTRSIDESQSFAYAQGGLARAQYALASSPYLESVTHNLPLEYVIRADAAQLQSGVDTMHTGPVDWDGNDVLITVQTSYHGIVRTFSGQFEPQQAQSYYRRLFTSADTIHARYEGIFGEGTHDRSAYLTGGFWQNDSDTSWTLHMADYQRKGIRLGGVPIPAVDSYISSHSLGAPPPGLSVSGGDADYTLNGSGPGTVNYFYSPAGSAPASIDENNYATIHVSGWVVWMLDRGAYFDKVLTVEGPPNSCLVIVAKHSSLYAADPSLGLWMFGGLHVRNTGGYNANVILVSNGSVRFDHNNNYDHGVVAERLAVFARGIEIKGPRADHTAIYSYDLSMSPLIAQLGVLGALPNENGAQGQFALRAGTWHEDRP